MENEWVEYLDDFLVDIEEFAKNKIIGIEAFIGVTRYVKKFVIATGEFEEARNLILLVNIGDYTGIGEAPLGNTSEEEIIEGLTTFESKFIDRTFNDYIDFIKENKLQNWLGLATEMAMLDAIAKAKGIRYGDLFSKAYLDSIETDVTIGIMSLNETVELFEKFLAKGFRKIKVKVGLDLRKDMERLKALFDVAPNYVSFRVDVNQGYSRSEAIEFIRFLEREASNLEFIEQPLKKDELEAIGELRDLTDIPIIVDESVRVKEDVERVSKYVDGVNLKPIKSGGILEISYSYLLAKELALLTMIGCSSESNIGITSSTYIASTRNVDFVDLDSDILQEPLLSKQATIVQGGMRILPEKAGLGITREHLIDSKLKRIY